MPHRESWKENMGVEKKTQLFFFDDNSFQFIKRPLKYSCFVEEVDGNIIRGWKHFYGNQLNFPGYKNMAADTVTLGHARDIILDPFDKIPTGKEVNQKPTKDTLTDWIAKVAENQRHTYRAKRSTMTTGDKVTWVLIGVLALESLGWFIRFMTG